VCFDGIQEHYTARALAKVAPLERLGAFTVPIAPMTASPRFNKCQLSRSVFNEMPAMMATVPYCTTLSTSPPHSDNGRGGYKPFSATSGTKAMQNIDSIHIARVKRTDRVGLDMQNGGGLTTMPRKHTREQQDRKKLSIADLTAKPDRSLATTEFMAHSTAWSEFELEAAGVTNFSASFDGCSALSRMAPPMTLPTPTRRRQSKTSMDSQVLELEAQMERLLEARRRISVALKNSQRQIARARRDKSALDEAALKFRDMGYSSEHEEGDLALDADVEHLNFDNASEDGSRLNSSESTALTTTTTTTTTTSDNEYEDAPHENARYCDESYEEDSTDNDEDATTNIIRHPAQVLPHQRSRRPPPRLPTPRLTPALSDSYRCFQSMEPPTLDVAATHADLGAALLASGRSFAAVTAFRDALRLDGDNADVWHQLAMALDAAGNRSKEAEEAARCAVELQPASLASLSLLGKLLHARGEHGEAISMFRRALELQKC
jgi:tetratricopeptide (TPR) repeat protein